MRHRPNEMCNEAFIMFTNNKTSSWMENKYDTEKAALLKDAHQLVPVCESSLELEPKKVHVQEWKILGEDSKLKSKKVPKRQEKGKN